MLAVACAVGVSSTFGAPMGGGRSELIGGGIRIEEGEALDPLQAVSKDHAEKESGGADGRPNC